MNHKLSISLPHQQYAFIEQYQKETACTSRSDVIKQAIYLLQQNYLEQCYKQANSETKQLDDEFSSTLFDGLDNETW